MPTTLRSALRNVRVLDGLGLRQERCTVLIEDGIIRACGPARTTPVPRGFTELDVHGLTVLPGLIDCHVHLCLGGEPDVVATIEQDAPGLTLIKSLGYAKDTLAAGFTTVRDVGFRDHGVFALKRAIDEGLVAGPRIVAAGLAICMTGGHARFIGVEADGVDGVIAAVRAQLAAGADVIKVIASGGVLTPGTSPDQAQFSVAELRAAVEEAGRAGRRVAAHAHGASGMKQAIAAGVHSIEHATLMDAEAAAGMIEQGVFMVATLSALATTAACPLHGGVPASAIGKAKQMRVRHEHSFQAALKQGVRIAMGTDAGTPFNYHGENAQELDRMVTLGMSPMDAITATTHSAAQLLGLDESIGSIAVGKRADLLLVDGDPSRRIGILRDRDRLMGVMQNGRLVSGPLAQA
ncbi:MAG: amidohydrolase family protein [Nitrospiraceae bacterium]